MARTIDLRTVMQQFDDMVKSELHNYEFLAGACREYESEGTTFNLPLFGDIELVTTDFGTGGIPVTDPQQRNVTVNQENFQLKTTIGGGYKTLFAYDVIEGHVKQHAQATARYMDFLKINAITQGQIMTTSPLFGGNADTAMNPATALANQVNLGTGTATDFTVNKIVSASAKSLDNGVPFGSSTFWVPALLMGDLQSNNVDNRFSNWEFNDVRTIQHGIKQTLSYNGMMFHQIGGASSKNQLPTGTTATNLFSYMVYHEAIAVCYNRRPMTRVIPEPWEDRVTVLTSATAGSHVVFPNGIIRVISNKAA